MKIELEIMGMAWAIRPQKLEEMTAFIEARLDKKDFEGVKAAAGKSGNKADQPYQVINGTAVIPIYGAISKRMNMMTDISGGTSAQLIQRDIGSAIKDPKVTGILLDIESPGGSVDGTKELADFIFSSRGKKPIVAYANGMMASAAYWIGSAADTVIASDTAMVGSIGVVMTHRESSVADAQSGVKKTDIYAGKYKRIASSNKPLTEDGQAYLQGMVDSFYSLFVESVAKNRGCDMASALKMADGKEFVGKQALDVGLVDSIGTMDFAMTQIKKRSVNQMDIKALREQEPDLFAQVKKMGADEAMAVLTEVEIKAEARGIAKENARVTEILEAGGDPTTTIECVKTGIDSGNAFKMFFQAEKKNKSDKLSSMASGAPKAMGVEFNAPEKKSGSDFMSEVKKQQVSGKNLADAMQAVRADQPELYKAFQASENKRMEA